MEHAIQTVKRILRTHLLALEDKVKAKISVGHPIFACWWTAARTFATGVNWAETGRPRC